MDSLLARKLIVVTGKGGTGKTTIAAAIGMLAAGGGLKTVVLDAVGDGGRLRRLFHGGGAQRPGGDAGSAASVNGTERQPDGAPPACQPGGTPGKDDGPGPHRLAENLSVLSIEPEAALADWMQALAGRLPTRMLTSRASFQYFAAAAPGARELVSMSKVWSLASGEDDHSCDLVVLDAPATGHALAMLDSPRTFGAIARMGPLSGQADAIRELLLDPARTGYLAVALASEMAVTETLELQDRLRERLGVELASVIVNATLRRRFSAGEVEQIGALAGNGAGAAQRPLARAAVAAARTAHERGRLQHNQLARLRRHRLPVLQIPFVFQPDLDLQALSEIAAALDGRI